MAEGGGAQLRAGNETPGHSQIDDDAAAVVELHDDILAPAANPGEVVANHCRAKAQSGDRHHIGAQNGNGGDDPAGEHAVEPARDRFGLGELGHGIRKLPARSC